MPTSRIETQEMAHEALEAAESARNSVQNYRKKLSSLKGRVEDVEDLEGEVDSISTRIEYHSGSLDGLRSRKADESDVNRIEERLEVNEQERDEMMEHVDSRLDAQEEAIRELREDTAQLHDDVTRLETKVDEIIEEMEKGRIDRLRERFADD